MDKLISFFQPEKRRVTKIEEEIEERSDTQTEDRRKWSISRSGRMKQANRKRLSVAKDLYGEACAPVERPTSMEYHVNIPKPLDHIAQPNINTPTPRERPLSENPIPSEIPTTREIPTASDPFPKSPEEEIESAFEILDKVDKLEKAS